MSTLVKKPNLRNLLIIAFPMIISQGSETVMMFVDRLFLADVSALHMTSAMSGGLSAFVFTAFFSGLVGYVNALTAQYYGSGKLQKCSQTAFQGIMLSFIVYPVLLLLIPPVKQLFIVMGHQPGQVKLEYQYYSILMLGSLLIVLRSTLAAFFLGIGKTKIVMISNVIGMCINIPLNYILIYGKLGFPALGIKGAAIGTICGSFTIAIILLAVYFSNKYNLKYYTRKFMKFNKKLMKKLLQFGLPAGGELFLSVFAFNIFVQLMHSYSPEVANSVSLTFTFDMMAFIPMIGIGVATTAIVGQQIGKGSRRDAIKATHIALKVAVTYASVMALLFLIIPGPLVTLFAGKYSIEEKANIIPLAKLLLRLASIYTLADAMQLVFGGALRGAGDTKWVLRMSLILHYVMAAIAFVMIKVVKTKPEYVWLVFITTVLTLGASFYLRFRFGSWKKIELIEKSLYGQLAPIYDQIFPLRKEQLNYVLNSVEKSDIILDVGCASGTLVSELHSKEFKAIGIDPSSDMIDLAIKQNPDLSLYDMDLETYIEEHSGEKYNLITCFGNTLPHLGNEKQIEEFLSQMYSSLSSNGTILIEMINFHRFHSEKENTFPDIETETHLFERNYSGENPLFFNTKLTLKETGKAVKAHVPLFVIYPEELKEKLEEAGFTDIKMFQNYENTEFTNDAFFVLVKAKR